MNSLDTLRSQRLDQKIVDLLPRLSRASAAKLIEQGKVTVNNKTVTKPGHKISPADNMHVDYDLTQSEQIPEIDLPVIYEDEDCVVINKPIGVLTHSKGAFNPEATVATWLSSQIQKTANNSSLLEERPLTEKNCGREGIVHRLDRATSGVMICAKTPEALSWLQKQFSQRKVKKVYYAVVQGKMPHDHALIDMPIERNPKKPQTFRTGANGKSAMTEYFVRAVSRAYSLLELQPQTGRTHQLRVHLAAIGHPIVGDTLYGGQPADRLYLHAESLEITLLSRERKTFAVPLPKLFRAKIEA